MNAGIGCDGVISFNNPIQSENKVVVVVTDKNNNIYWTADFGFLVRIESILLIKSNNFRNDFGWGAVTFTVGDLNTNNYRDNAECIGGQLALGGWLNCARSGRYLALIGT